MFLIRRLPSVRRKGGKADAEKDINETNMQSALKGIETEIEKDSGAE